MEKQESEFKPGEAVIYQNGDSFELGIVKRLGNKPGTCFVWYHTGDTAACTPKECLHKIKNEYAFKIERLNQGEIEAPKKVPLSEIIKDPNKAIHCPTSEEAKALCKELGKRGLRWNDGSSYSRKNNYSFCGSNTCYYPYNGTYYSESGSKICGFNIIEFSEVDLMK